MYYSEKFDAYMFSTVEEIDKYGNLPEINNFIFDKIKRSLCQDSEIIILFYVYIQSDKKIYTTSIKKENVIQPLKKCLSKFELEEEYEKCMECIELIKLIEK